MIRTFHTSLGLLRCSETEKLQEFKYSLSHVRNRNFPFLQLFDLMQQHGHGKVKKEDPDGEEMEVEVRNERSRRESQFLVSSSISMMTIRVVFV